MSKKRLDHLLSQPIPREAKIAFVCSFCLGDTLMSLVTVNNFVLNGYTIEVYGDYAYELREWFPQLKIFPLIKENAVTILQKYDVLLHMYETELSRAMAISHPFSITLSHSKYYLADMTMTDIQVLLCQKEFKLPIVKRINDIQSLTGLQHRKNNKRIIFHPTSSLQRKNWPAKKFVKLAHWLRDQGYAIYFIVSSKERPEWLWVKEEGIHLPQFESLNQVAAFVYESGYFIGNDSGIGHLASNLGVPTVSIILRKGVAKQWRPTWAPAKIVLSPRWLNPRPIKEKLWKTFTRVSHVKQAFIELEEQLRVSY